MTKAIDKKWMLWAVVVAVACACTWSILVHLNRAYYYLQTGVTSARIYVSVYMLAIVMIAIFSVATWKLRRWGRLGLVSIVLLVAAYNAHGVVQMAILVIESRSVQSSDYHPAKDILFAAAYALPWVTIPAVATLVLYRSVCARLFR